MLAQEKHSSCPEWNSRPILIVDDDLSIRPLLLAMLRKINPNSSVDWASSANEALAKLLRKSKSYGVVLVDVNLGKGPSGLELTKECFSWGMDSKIVLCTGAEHLKTRFPVVRKPIQFQELNAAVAPYLNAPSLPSKKRASNLFTGVSLTLYICAMAYTILLMNQGIRRFFENSKLSLIEDTPLVRALKDPRFMTSKNLLLNGGLTPLLKDEEAWKEMDRESRESIKRLSLREPQNR